MRLNAWWLVASAPVASAPVAGGESGLTLGDDRPVTSKLPVAGEPGARARRSDYQVSPIDFRNEIVCGPVLTKIWGMQIPKSYRDLEIFKISKKLAVELHKVSLTLPRFELYEEGSQLRRSAKAVTAMIVEGYGRRRYKADFIKHLVISITECDETILHLDFLYDTGSWTDQKEYKRLRDAYDVLSKRINTFTKWVEENWE